MATDWGSVALGLGSGGIGAAATLLAGIDGCQVPVFTYKPTSDEGSNLDDIAYTVQQWSPSVG